MIIWLDAKILKPFQLFSDKTHGTLKVTTFFWYRWTSSFFYLSLLSIAIVGIRDTNSIAFVVKNGLVIIFMFVVALTDIYLSMSEERLFTTTGILRREKYWGPHIRILFVIGITYLMIISLQKGDLLIFITAIFFLCKEYLCCCIPGRLRQCTR